MQKSNITIAREDGDTKGRYTAVAEDAEGTSELTYVRTRPDLVIVDHTFVPPALRGKGIAEKLVEAVVADARAEGFRIVPQCPYVAQLGRRRPDLAEVMDF